MNKLRHEKSGRFITKYTDEELIQMGRERNPNVEIIDISKDKNSIWTFRCHKCGGEYNKRRQYLTSSKSGFNCPICSGRLIVEGINDLLTQRPDLKPYIVDKNEAIKFGKSSKEKIQVKCPNCGFIKRISVDNLTKRGFICTMCGDGISMPNKFLRSFLIQFESSCDKLEFEYHNDWTNGKRYDAFFKYNNCQYVVEIDGEQHCRDAWWITKEEQKSNDKIKDELAKDNNVKMIRIKAYESSFEYIKQNIINSELSELFDINTVDWDFCKQNATKSIIVEASKFFNSNKDYSTTDVMNKYKISRFSAIQYLKRGTELGLCDYSIDSSIKKRNKRLARANKINNPKDFFVYKQDVLINHYYSISDCIKEMKVYYPNVIFGESSISKALHTNTTYHDLDFRYANISLEELYKNDLHIYEVCRIYNNTNNIPIWKISEMLNISKSKVSTYLIAGSKLGLCDYLSKKKGA